MLVTSGPPVTVRTVAPSTFSVIVRELAPTLPEMLIVPAPAPS